MASHARCASTSAHEVHAACTGAGACRARPQDAAASRAKHDAATGCAALALAGETARAGEALSGARGAHPPPKRQAARTKAGQRVLLSMKMMSSPCHQSKTKLSIFNVTLHPHDRKARSQVVSLYWKLQGCCAVLLCSVSSVSENSQAMPKRQR